MDNGKTVDYLDVFEHVNTIQPDVSEQAFKHTFLQAMETALGQGRVSGEEDMANHTAHLMNLEAYFQLLEREELQEARQATKDANRAAKAALVLSQPLI